MNYTNKLCNPTPYDVVWNYDRGIVIRIPKFGEYTLQEIQMVDDFRPDKAGAENVQMNMHQRGVFLLNPNVSYDVQAYECITKNIETLTGQYNESVANVKKQMSADMVNNKAEFESVLAQHGLVVLRDRLEELKRLAATYKKAVQEEKTLEEDQFDPERTVFVLPTGPRQFATKTAKNVFLGMPENAEIKAKHEEFMAKIEAAKATEETSTRPVGRPKKTEPVEAATNAA